MLNYLVDLLSSFFSTASLYPYAESCTDPFFESSIMFNIIGTVITAIIASITMIANSSIKVKALRLFIIPPLGYY